MTDFRWDFRPVSVRPTITAGAYSANDVVGGRLDFTIPWKAAGGFVDSVRIVDDANQKAAMTLYLFSRVPTAIADNAAFAPTVADLQALAGTIAIAATDYVTLNNNAVAIKRLNSDGAISFWCPDGILYGYAVVSGTPTYANAADLQFELRMYRYHG